MSQSYSDISQILHIVHIKQLMCTSIDHGELYQPIDGIGTGESKSAKTCPISDQPPRVTFFQPVWTEYLS